MMTTHRQIGIEQAFTGRAEKAQQQRKDLNKKNGKNSFHPKRMLENTAIYGRESAMVDGRSYVGTHSI